MEQPATSAERTTRGIPALPIHTHTHGTGHRRNTARTLLSSALVSDATATRASERSRARPAKLDRSGLFTYKQHAAHAHMFAFGAGRVVLWRTAHWTRLVMESVRVHFLLFNKFGCNFVGSQIIFVL